MRPRFRVILSSIVMAALAAACDSTPPNTGTQISGVITELGEIPNPPMDVKVRFWQGGNPSAHDADLLTDAGGAFALNLANIEPPVLDSIRVTATRYDCEGNRVAGATVRRADIAGAHAVTMPRINLNFELTRPEIGQGVAVCAAIPHRTATLAIDDMARLSIWIDDISDSVRGRWSADHSVSDGGGFGNFSGYETANGAVTELHLHLRPSETTSCPGLDLIIPTLDDGSAEMGVATLSGGAACALTDGPMRFFKGTN
jgi:hypothetical protein